MRRGAVVLGLAMFVPGRGGWTQEATAGPMAVPKPLTSAKTAFVSMGGAALPFHSREAASLLYASTMQALENGPYALTEEPSTADLFLAVSFRSDTDVTNGNSTQSNFVRLTMTDGKTHALLWVLDEDVQGAFRKVTFAKHLDEATAKLASDVKVLAAGKLP